MDRQGNVADVAFLVCMDGRILVVVVFITEQLVVIMVGTTSTTGTKSGNDSGDLDSDSEAAVLHVLMKSIKTSVSNQSCISTSSATFSTCSVVIMVGFSSSRIRL